MRQIVLASSSPRRKELLENSGCATVDAGASEDLSMGMSAQAGQRNRRQGRLGGMEVSRCFGHRGGYFGILNRILGKPKRKMKREMLAAISGRWHLVITGFTVIDTACGKIVSHSVETKVYIRKISPEEIEAYIKTGEPLGKAGGYAIQGLGALFVEKIEGDYFNVVGLPMYALMNTLREFGISII